MGSPTENKEADLSSSTTSTTSTQSQPSGYGGIGGLNAVCFLGGTPIETEQGEINIENITDENTIDGRKVIGIVECINKDNWMIEIQKDSLGENIPSNWSRRDYLN